MSDDRIARDIDEFERLGRRAGEELRTPAPSDGDQSVQRSVRRRRAAVALTGVGVTSMLLVVGLLVINRNRQLQPDDQRPPQPPPSLATLPLKTTPGTWRAIPDAPLAPAVAYAAVWTGTDAIVLGLDGDAANPEPSAVAYDVAHDQWRRLADPPSGVAMQLRSGSSAGLVPDGTAWTGRELLVATQMGDVFAYDPLQDTWTARPAALEPLKLVAVSARGVLARSEQGWWWQEAASTGWQAVPLPALGVDYTLLSVLDANTLVATHADGSTFTSSVFDADTKTWQEGPAVVGPPITRDEIRALGVNGLLVLSAEGYSGLHGVAYDPLLGSTLPFKMGEHSNALTVTGIPWWTHDWKLLDPHTAAWEELPSYENFDGFGAAVWTGSEIVFFGGNNSASRSPLTGQVAAYTPLSTPRT